MKKTPARLYGLSTILLALMVSGVRADGILWTSTWSNTPTIINANNPGTGYIVLTPNSTPLTHEDTSYLAATNISTYSTATASNPDVFTNKQFELDLSLTDNASGATHLFAFTGAFNGTLTKYQSLVSPSWTGSTSQSFVIGSNDYTVSVGPYSWPDVPGSVSTGAISFLTHVAVTPPVENPPGNGGSPNQTPEPGTLLLSGIGLSLGAIGWMRKRRQDNPEAESK